MSFVGPRNLGTIVPLDVPSNFVLASPFGSQGSIEFSRALQTRIASRIGMSTRFWTQKPSPITEGSCAVAWSSQYSILSLSFSLVWSDAKGASLRKKKGLLQMEGGDRSFRSDGTLILWKIANKPRPYFLPLSVPSFLPSFLLLLLFGRPLCLKGIFLFRLFLQGGRRSLS